jgi:hypothetical protein
MISYGHYIDQLETMLRPASLLLPMDWIWQKLPITTDLAANTEDK